MKNFITQIHYSKNLKPHQLLLKLFLAFGTIFYSIVVNIRNCLYNIGILETIKVKAKVISIGNLTTGGTGKTPITAELAKICAKSGTKTVILSRGYGGKLSSKEIHKVSDGENVFLTAQEAGDEPFWLATNIKKVSVIICKDRAKAAKWATEELGAEIIILDDGYQYRRLERDLNLLLVDGHKKFGNEMLLPAGPLREPQKEAKRADKIIVVNKTPYSEESVRDCRAYSRHLIKLYDKEVFGCHLSASGIHNAMTKTPVFHAQKVFAFTGIAQPDAFFASLEAYKHTLVKKLTFEDHYAYTQNDIQKIIDEAKISGADIIVTTEKDIVKIKPFLENAKSDIPICILRLTVEMDIASLLKNTIEY